MDERFIEKKLREGIKKSKGIAYKFVSPGNSGVPDRIVLLPGGKIIFVELKRLGERPKKHQLAQIRRIRNLGFDVRVLSGIEDVKGFLDEIQTTQLPEILH